MRYQMCVRCVMDTSDEDIAFDGQGVCNYCNSYTDTDRQRQLDSAEAHQELHRVIESIRSRARSNEYDCVIGLSGGVDSSYVALRVRELGLKPLAVHTDTGWNSEIAVSNIESIVKTLDIDLFTHVVDWEEMRDLQLSFLKSGVANCDIPQDHAIIATLFKAAEKFGVKTIISGQNLATESILPDSWGYTNIDKRHINAVQESFGTCRLRKYPSFNIFQYGFWWPVVRGIRIVPILNYMPYIKVDARLRIEDELGWRDYGGKHHESRFTRFFQAYYLPRKFGYDKRRAHLSSLIVSGQLTRNDALEELQEPLYSDDDLANTLFFVARKLRISEEELQEILDGPHKTHRDYPSNEQLFAVLRRLKQWARTGA